MPAKDVHGTWTRYSVGCRCDKCRVAASDYGRARRARKKELPEFLKPPHGRDTRYTTYGCRCDICKAAHAAARTARYRKVK